MRYLFLCFAVILFACNSSTDTKETTEEKTISIDSVIVQRPVSETASTLAGDTGTDCARGVAASIIKKDIFPKNTFQLQADNVTGIETVELEQGDKVIIKNWGCKYYALTFRFETSRFQSELDNAGFWYKRAVSFINEVAKGVSAPIELTKASEVIVERIEAEVPNGYKNLKFGEEINMMNGDIREFVSIDKVEQLSDKKFAIEITIARGPL